MKKKEYVDKGSWPETRYGRKALSFVAGFSSGPVLRPTIVHQTPEMLLVGYALKMRAEKIGKEDERK